MTALDPPSPCTEVCSIDEDTGLCSGCGRTLDEIACWAAMSADEKWDVLRRVDQRRGKGDGPTPAGG